MSKEIVQWADSYMFEAEEIDAAKGPEVYLLSCNPDPLGSIAVAAKAYKGEFVKDLAEVTDEERRYYLAEIQKTALAMPLEAVNLHFRIKGVTRGFTHQMVRQRTAAYSQESTRFAVKSGVPVSLPPSIAGTEDRATWRSKQDWVPLQEDMREVDWLATEERFASKEERWRFKWDNAVKHLEQAYNELVNDGMPAEDARGLLPTNLLTQLNYITSLRGLKDHAGSRLCTQAQHEWKVVWAQILDAIVEYGKGQMYRHPFADMVEEPERWKDNGQGFAHSSSAWQFEELARVFKPACFYAGKCTFKAGFDRKCNIRSKVDAFADHNVPSTEWPMGRADLGIPAIRAEEWTRADAAR